MAGNDIPKQARMMCHPSDNAIWLRAGSSASDASRAVRVPEASTAVMGTGRWTWVGS